MSKRTYLTLFFQSEGARPTEVTDRLTGLGFKPLQGQRDYLYEWDASATVQDTIWFADKVHETLRGCGVAFSLETNGE